MADGTLGMFEERVRFDGALDGDGAPRETVTTPSQFALADEWTDRLRATGGHTSGWIGARAAWATWMLAAHDEGLWPSDELSLPNVYEFVSALRPARVPRADAPSGANPTQAAPEGGPEAR